MKTPRDAFIRILEVLDLLEIPYFVGGSVASSIHGLSRPTMDTDLIVDLRPDQVAALTSELSADFYADTDMILDAIQQARAANIIHSTSTYKFDLFPLGRDEYSRVEFGRRRFVETHSFGDPIECAVATAEDTILRKLVWYRKGREQSDRQWNDLRGILRLQRGALDLGYMETWASQLGVDDLLTRLFNERA